MAPVRPQQHRLQWPITREQWEGVDEMLGALFKAVRQTNAATSAESGVTAGEYGDATHVPQITVDETGRVTDASEIVISAGVTTTGSPANGNLTKFSGASSITNGDLSGDVTTSGALAATIANDAVTYAKMQNVSAASKLLGRGDSGSGDPQEITLGSGLAMSGTTLTSSGSTGALVLLEQHTASGSSSLDFTTAITGTYDDYQIELVNVLPASSAVHLQMRMSTDGGSTYDSGANYAWGLYLFHYNFAAVGGIGGNSGQTEIRCAHSADNTANYGINGTIRLFDPGGSSYTPVQVDIVQRSSDANLYRQFFTGTYLVTTAVNAFRFLMSSGNIASGTIRVYGIAKT